MTYPTPDPDTLRAAVEALAAAWESKASRPPRGQLTESVQASFHACAVNLRAALDAELAAPADSPDQRPTYFEGDLGLTYEEDARPAAVTAPREDEHGAPGSPERAAYIAGWDGGMKFALAAVAPAVERAIPDPDTLEDQLVDLLRECGPGWYLRDTARALIAAGVTLNETESTS